MPLFEFEAGRLVPAQVGHALGAPLEPAVLEAVRAQVLELIAAPVFPVAWHEDGGGQWLTAMSVDARPVTIVVVDRLDAAALVAALARRGTAGQASWAELAAAYPRGTAAFRRDWNAFREAQPVAAAPAARLHVVAARIDEDVRSAIAALTGAEVRVHELAARVMSSGRLFLDVVEVGPAAAPLPWLTPGRGHEALPAGPGPRPSAAGEASRAAGDASRAVESGAGEQPAASPTSEMRAIGQSLADPAPLVWTHPGGHHEATITPQGWIELDGRSFADPELAAAAVGGEGDAWTGWRFGQEGPSLHEARVELRAYRDQRRRRTGRSPSLSRRARRRREAIG